MEIVIATENLHKVTEFKSVLEPEHKLLLPSEISVNYHFEETGKTYFENAYGKALALYNECRKPVMADDSGLSVEALDGAPGLYSARFGSKEKGEKLSDEERNLLLLKKLEGVENRKAFFVCSLVLLFNPYRFVVFQETVEGDIAQSQFGSNGFGYDPVFFIPAMNKHMAELSESEKNAISHRGKSASALKAYLSMAY